MCRPLLCKDRLGSRRKVYCTNVIISKSESNTFFHDVFVIHRPYAAGSRQLSRALTAMEGFLGHEAYRGNFENKNLDYHWSLLLGAIVLIGVKCEL